MTFPCCRRLPGQRLTLQKKNTLVVAVSVVAIVAAVIAIAVTITILVVEISRPKNNRRSRRCGKAILIIGVGFLVRVE